MNIEKEFEWNLKLKEVLDKYDYSTGHDVITNCATMRWINHSLMTITFGGGIEPKNIINGMNMDLFMDLLGLISEGTLGGVSQSVMIGLIDMAIFQHQMELRLSAEREKLKADVAALGVGEVH